LIETVLAYAARGWRVLPLFEIQRNGRCACGNECGRHGKHPRTRHGCSDASTDTNKIRHWWTKWPNANVGIATGLACDLLVLDIDPQNEGDAGFAEIEVKHGPLPATLTVRTGGGGRHFYFLHPGPGTTIKNIVGLRRGIDVRGDGGYVVAPPSRHRSGDYYTVILDVDPAPAPAWLLTAASACGLPRIDRMINEPARTTGGGYPKWLPERIATGTRHGMLTRFAGWLRGIGYEEPGILAELRDVVRTRVEQPTGDQIADTELARLARAIAQKPVKRFGLRARYEPTARTWEGTAGRTDRRVLFTGVLPTFARRIKLGERVAPLPTLNIANAADIGDRTAARSLKRLRIERKVIRLAARRARQEGANRYRLLPPAHVSHRDEGMCSYDEERSSSPSSSREIATLLRDLFRHEALGHVAGDVYRALLEDDEQRPAVLAAKADCALSSVYRVCRRMAANGLVVKVGDGWRRSVLDRDTLTAIARSLGVLEKGAAEWARRQLKREVYHSESSQRQRDQQRERRNELQQRLLAVAQRSDWPPIDQLNGERAWRAFARTQSTRTLWRMLARLRSSRARRDARVFFGISARTDEWQGDGAVTATNIEGR